MERDSDLSNGMVAGWLSEKSKPSLESLEKFLIAFPDVNANWLLFGKGEMIPDPEPIAHEPLIAYEPRDKLSTMAQLQLDVERLKGENDGLREAIRIIAARIPEKQRPEDEPLQDGTPQS